MTWKEIEKIMKGRYDVIVEVNRDKNKYFMLKDNVHYKLNSCQFDKLLEGGWIDPDYRLERNSMFGYERHVYEGR